MSQPREPDPVKYISSIFAAAPEIVDDGIRDLADLFGPVDRVSEPLFFDRTRYYEKEMGWPLYRRFISFQDLMPPGRLVEVKIQTNGLEQRSLAGAKRRINIDPGYVCAERLILATGKNYVHRIYLRKGIYADLTLVYRKGAFHPLEWTYPDYRQPDLIRFFNETRTVYMEQLKERKRID